MLTINKQNTSIQFRNPLIGWQNSYQLNKIVSERSGRHAFLSFSLGKDSIASFLAMQESGFWDTITPVFYYYVPGLSFEDQALEYLEGYFKTKIIRLPSPNMLTDIAWSNFQTPQTAHEAKKMRGYVFECGFDNTDKWVRTETGHPEAWMATGVRMADGMNRRGAILKHGGMREAEKKFYPIFDFTDNEVAEIIKAHGVKLPYDYAIWGRTFDGVQYRFIKELKQHLPEDFEKIKDLYPLIETVLLRYEILTNKNIIL